MNSRSNHDAIILLADGFDESWLASCLIKLRTGNNHTAVVGLRPGRVAGKHGLAVHTDTHLSEIRHNRPKLLVIANGRLCASRLMTDPRVFKLMEQTLEANGRVAISLDSEIILKKYRLIQAKDLQQFIWQRHTAHEEYAQHLADILA